MATSKIGLSKPTIINTSVSHTFLAANAWEYSGLSITIPANSEVALQFENVWSNAHPAGIAITDSNSVAPTGSNQGYNYIYSETTFSACFCGYRPTEITLYVWGKAKSAATNMFRVSGTIRTYNS